MNINLELNRKVKVKNVRLHNDNLLKTRVQITYAAFTV